MKPAFFAIVGAQFFSSLADSALFILCVSLVTTLAFPEWMTPMLKMGFVLSYILLAPFAGAFADMFPKGRVMLATNTIKMLGCSLILAKANPLLAYGIVGFGASAYSPAKYGILAEVLPARRLVAANGWIEGSTVVAMILGTILGGLISANQHTIAWLLRVTPAHDGIMDTPVSAAVLVIVLTYFVAGVLNLCVLNAGPRYAKARRSLPALLLDFYRCNSTLWRDREGRVSLGVTSLFWGAGMVLQILLLAWARSALGLSLDKAAALQGVFALGVVIGAAIAGKTVPLVRSMAVMPVGIVLGVGLCAMVFVHTVQVALPLLLAIGVLAGLFVVPMNAILQHRGHSLMSAGQSIAVQNFNENLAILAMTASYAMALQIKLEMNTVLVLLGILIALTTIYLRAVANSARHA
ncbi:lysophospholipid transporter LplT [Massilia norwichensis]|jgi:MFS transporter, LPLT family, lysophospholipid transporter|uniref:Lysophospholipid transporter LplT n=1 Tax=Massilia norwichensis TaxID=1442366 RepID=A0ABT2A6L2_9BURK|nr:lysophospholipid transporter LplT [Massilia norwichensis]MCS0589832.1 lysophospholipid transporter LplT [Massilia norwichensis]